ncbi:MAG: hypothetical protein DMG24_11420 [Acidobacteria bacterium]|nr:MAG: hypothetical protein DMG24_11420 [Acidobacteriota bacterium]
MGVYNPSMTFRPARAPTLEPISGRSTVATRLTVGISLAALVLAGYQSGRAGPDSEPFSPGETLTYDLSWQIFPAGELVATLTRSGQGAKDAYEVKATAQSKGFVSLLYTVQDEFRSVFDPHTLCSQSLSKKVNEGRRHKNTQIVFDSARKLAILDERDLATQGAPPKHAENAAPACVEDVISAFYFIRRQPLRVGEQIRLPINDGSRTADVRVEVQALEKIRTPLGTQTAFRVEPTVFGGLLKRKGRMLMWFSDDQQHLPLRVKAIISVGTITADLKSVATPPAVPPPGKH